MSILIKNYKAKIVFNEDKTGPFNRMQPYKIYIFGEKNALVESILMLEFLLGYKKLIPHT